MKKTAAASAVAAALALMGAAPAANAAGFAVTTQGVSGLGNGYAGAAAVAEDASTVWWNPAGMAWLPSGKHVAGAAAFVSSSTKFSDNGGSVAARPGANGNGGDAGQSTPVPSGFFAMDVGPRWNVGLGVSGPFGNKTEYESTWIGRFQGISSEIKTLNINPAVSYKFSDAVSAGFGVNYMEGDIRLLSAVNLGAAEAQNRTNVNGNAWGFNAGVQVRPTPDTRVGMHYRSSVDFKLRGDTSFSAPAPATLNSGVKINVNTPDSLMFSIAQRMGRFDLLADATWFHWSKINQLPVVRTDGPLGGQTLDTLTLDFKDTVRLSVGTNYKFSDAWTFKVGAVYDQTPVRDPQRRTVRLPDNNRYWLTAGLKWQPAPNHALDIGAAYIKVEDADIANDQRAAGRGLVSGTYDSKIRILGIQYQVTF
jgi:long-chain fatty acid transport protein